MTDHEILLLDHLLINSIQYEGKEQSVATSYIQGFRINESPLFHNTGTGTISLNSGSEVIFSYLITVLYTDGRSDFDSRQRPIMSRPGLQATQHPAQ
jgi:hypothetical protein